MSDIMNNNLINTENIIIIKRFVMRKNFSVFFIVMAFIISCSVFFGYTMVNKVFADEIKLDKEINGASKSAILIDAESGAVLYSRNENSPYPIASMCKIMTLLLTFEGLYRGEFALSDKIVVSENASGMGGSQVFLESNAEYEASELIKSITVASANDACVAMAERLCGSEELFVETMNKRAKELGMNDTVFVNCTGLPKIGQHSSAKDVAKMFSELVKHKEYFTFSGIWIDEIKHPKGRITQISNTNKLIRFYNGCDAGKTGYTSEAGHCLCASAVRNGLRLISVVISAPDSKSRFNEVSSLFNYGFANYENKAVVKEGEPLDISLNIKGGKKENISVSVDKTVSVLSRKNEKKSVDVEFIANGTVKAPICKGDVVGKLNVFESGVLIAEVSVVSLEDVESKSFFDALNSVIKKWSIVS